MIDGLKPYPEYKESGMPWLGQVPEHWEVRNLRTFITKRAERDRPDLPLLSVAREKGVFVRSLTDEKENHNVISEDLKNYKVAHVGDLVINKMKAWQGSMGIAPCDGIVSPAYYVFSFRISNHAYGQALLRSKGAVALARTKDSGCVASHRYPVIRGREEYISSAVLLAVLRTPYGSMLFDHHSRGAAGRNRPLNARTFLKEKVLIPPNSAQARITELLDQEYAIAQSLAQTIQLLNEYRTRLVADVVTGKLDVHEAAAKLARYKETVI